MQGYNRQQGRWHGMSSLPVPQTCSKAVVQLCTVEVLLVPGSVSQPTSAGREVEKSNSLQAMVSPLRMQVAKNGA